MICTGMFGNGAAISGMTITMAHRLTEVLGKLEHIMTECSVVVPVTTMQSFAVCRSSLPLGGLWFEELGFSRSGGCGFSLVLAVGCVAINNL